ncbi:MAG: prenyltransferase/squalene oxidase repeat-containing protein, partial [Ilumatobacteraceae bacterium]
PSAAPALSWLESQLAGHGGVFGYAFDLTVTDWGLTIDAILALDAGGRSAGAAATTATAALAAHLGDYITGEAFGDVGSHYSGPIGKALLAAEAQGADIHAFGGVDLEAASRARLVTGGTVDGRFSDASTFGDNSNGFGQALNVLALSKTPAGAPSNAVEYLLAQQCPSGGFRLFYDATRGCASDAEADTDSTSFAIEALLALAPTPAQQAAVTGAVTFLRGQQDPVTGGFHGTGPTAAANTNTTGLAVRALTTLGAAGPAAFGRDFIGSLQLEAAHTSGTPAAGDEGAIALNQGAYDDGLTSGVEPSRPQWWRATTQAVLALISLPRADPQPVTPSRLLDTRAGASTVDGQQSGAGLTPAGSTLILQVGGRAGVPTDAAAVVLNITADGATGPGFITAYPCDANLPLTSSLNFVADTPVANAVVTGLSSTGTACLFVGTNSVNLIADVGSFFPAASGYHALTPARLLDTRTGESTVDSRQVGAGSTAGGSTLVLPVAGRGGVDANADAVVLNVTAVGATGPGVVTVYACDSGRPLASNLNFVAGSITANTVVTRLAADGTVCLYVGANAVNLVADVNGYFPAGSGYHAVAPARLLDNRAGESTMDGLQAGAGSTAAGSTIVLPVAGRGGVALGATTVVLNVTAVGASGPGFVTVFPCDSTRPLASNLNFVDATATPNAVVARLSADGTVCLFVGTNPVNLVADVSGYFG